eukprot:3778426-Amphidinium_carterae.1
MRIVWEHMLSISRVLKLGSHEVLPFSGMFSVVRTQSVRTHKSGIAEVEIYWGYVLYKRSRAQTTTVHKLRPNMIRLTDYGHQEYGFGSYSAVAS